MKCLYGKNNVKCNLYTFFNSARPRLPHFHQRLQPVKAAIQQWQEILHYNVNSTGDNFYNYR